MIFHTRIMEQVSPNISEHLYYIVLYYIILIGKKSENLVDTIIYD